MSTRAAPSAFAFALLLAFLSMPALAQNQNQGQGFGGPGQGGNGGQGFGGPGQGGPGQGGPGGGGFGGGRGGQGMFGPNGQIDPAMMQQFLQQMEARQMDNIKQALDSTDDEFTVLQPKIEKLLTLQATDLVSQIGVRMGGRGGGFQAAIASALPPSEVQTAAAALQLAIDDKDSSAELIANRLAILRAARSTAHDQLIIAQNEFKELLTQRQEAAMVLMGLLP